jgi:hypothetical protein
MPRWILENRMKPWWDLIVIGILIFCYLLSQKPEFAPDSLTYFTLSPIRPPLYPLFLRLFSVFGQHQLIVAMWVQTLICFGALVYVRMWLQSRLGMPPFLLFIILLFTTLLIFFHYKTLNTFVSEAISFPLFIVTFVLFIECFHSFDKEKIILLNVGISLLILTRTQFNLLSVGLVILIAWYAWIRIPLKKIAYSILIMSTAFIATIVLHQSYHYVVHGKFSGNPMMGEYLSVQAFYLADKSDAQYFANADEKDLFIKILNQLEQKQYTIKSAPKNITPPSFQINNSYFTAVYSNIESIINQTLKNTDIYQADHLLRKISKTLYLHHAKEHVQFYLWKVAAFYGDLAFFLTYLLVLFTLMLRMLIHKTSSCNDSLIFITLSLLFIVGNTLFVGLFEPLLASYFFYCYFLIFCLGGIVAKKYLFNK